MAAPSRSKAGRSKVGRSHPWRNRGLSIAFFALFLVTWVGQGFFGWQDENNERALLSEAPISLSEYVASGSFLEATMENWESEFLQMFAFIVLTIFLFQKGSAESKDPEEPKEPDPPVTAKSPKLVRIGGWRRKLYEHSLSLAFFALFAVSFVLHAVGGVEHYNEEQLRLGGPTVTILEYLGSSRFWFESLQNWQSEFLSIWAMVVFTIFLRQRGSPESKPVTSPHDETGK